VALLEPRLSISETGEWPFAPKAFPDFGPLNPGYGSSQV
jgi:hypothetical protein